MGGTRRFLRGIADPIIGNGADSQSYIKGTGLLMAHSGEGRSLNNLWSGKTLGPVGKKALGGVAVGGLGIYAFSAGERDLDNRIQEESAEQDIESLPTSQSDGAGYTAYPQYNLQDYTPSGDLVFALHNNRHG